MAHRPVQPHAGSDRQPSRQPSRSRRAATSSRICSTQLNKGGKKGKKGSANVAKKNNKKAKSPQYRIAVVKTEFDYELPV